MYECFTCRYYVCCIPVWDSQRPENGWRILRLESNRRLWVLNVLLIAEHLSSPLIWFFRTGFMQSMLTLNFQCSWGWPWSPDPTPLLSQCWDYRSAPPPIRTELQTASDAENPHCFHSAKWVTLLLGWWALWMGTRKTLWCHPMSYVIPIGGFPT